MALAATTGAGVMNASPVPATAGAMISLDRYIPWTFFGPLGSVPPLPFIITRLTPPGAWSMKVPPLGSSQSCQDTRSTFRESGKSA